MLSFKKINKINMFKLKELGFIDSSLEPFISAKTIDFHYNKHHKTYLDNLNNLITGTDLENLSLESLILETYNKEDLRAVFNNAAQVYNHDFYWQSLLKSPRKENKAGLDLLSVIEKQFTSWDNFLLDLKNAGLKHFASGWLWLVSQDGKIKIVSTANADNPLTSNLKPLMVIDLWEHAYYLDYQNRRADYLDLVIKNLINWDFVGDNFFKN